MKYSPTFYFSGEDTEEVIYDFKHYHKIKLSNKQAEKIIRYNLKLFGASWINDKKINEVIADDDFKNQFNI